MHRLLTRCNIWRHTTKPRVCPTEPSCWNCCKARSLAQVAGQGLVVCNLRLERLHGVWQRAGLGRCRQRDQTGAAQLAQMVAGHGVLSRVRRDEFTVTYRIDHHSGRPGAGALSGPTAHSRARVRACRCTSSSRSVWRCSPSTASGRPRLLKKAEQALAAGTQATRSAGRSMTSSRTCSCSPGTICCLASCETPSAQQLSMHFSRRSTCHRCSGHRVPKRWCAGPTPVEGMISPAEFIPVAEESGLIRPLTCGCWPSRCASAPAGTSAGLLLSISINLSALNLLDPELPDALHAALAENSVCRRSMSIWKSPKAVSWPHHSAP
jgi:predicted signal transduction protein with EAL and GGDEF domain